MAERLLKRSTMSTAKYRLPQDWESAISGWVGWMRLSGIAATSIKTRLYHLRSIARVTGTPSPAALTLDDVVRLFSSRDWSREHRRAMRTSLSGFCTWCITHNLMDVNLGEELPRVRASRPAPRPATEPQWEDIMASAAPRERLMALMAGTLGLRRSEVAAAHLSDLIHDTHGYLLIVHGKGSKQRVVPVPDALAREIIDFCPGGFLFPSPGGGHLRPQYIGQLISALLGPATMHQLRHRFASIAYAETHDLRALQRVLGHSSLATTERYVMSADDDDRRLVDAVAKITKGPRSCPTF